MEQNQNSTISNYSKGYPKIPKRLIECLERDFPDKLPRKYQDSYELGILVGQQLVILYQLPLNGQMKHFKTGETEQVRRSTFVTEMTAGLNAGATKYPFLKIMFPFVKTGANILQMNLDHNAGYMIASDVVNCLTKKQKSLLTAQTKEGAMARSQVAFGLFSWGVALAVALSGKVTGSAPSDPKERKALFETGWKPYSIRAGNQYWSYQGIEPLHTILGFAADSVAIGANIVNSEDEAKWNKFTSQILALGINNFLDKATFRTGLRQLAVLTSPDDNMDNFLKSLAQTAQGFLPDSAFVRNVSSVGQREITTPTGYERIFNNYFNRGLGDYRRDVFGNRQDNIGLLLFNAAPDNTDLPEYEELERLAEFGFSPADIKDEVTSTSLNYKKFYNPNTGKSLYDAMYDELSTMTISGKTLQETVRELVTSDWYRSLPLGKSMNGYNYARTEDTQINAVRIK